MSESNLTIETFVLDAAVPEGARTPRLVFLYRLRDEMKFPSPAALQQQIAIDVQRAQKLFRMLNV